MKFGLSLVIVLYAVFGITAAFNCTVGPHCRSPLQAQVGSELPLRVWFRIKGYYGRALFSRNTFSPWVGAIPLASATNSDNWFQLLEAPKDKYGYPQYRLQSRETTDVLFVNMGQKPQVNNVNPNIVYPDQLFTLEAGDGDYAGMYRLRVQGQGAITLASGSDTLTAMNEFGPFPASAYFQFLWEDMAVDHIEYDFPNGKILSTTPRVLASQTLNNTSGVDQEMSFNMDETVTETSSFTYTAGLSIMVGTTFKVGIPKLAETEFSVEITASQEWSWGKEQSFEKGFSASFPVHAGPHTVVRATSSVNVGVIEVPFTLVLKSKSAGVEARTTGVWRGVSAWDLRHDTKEI